MEKSKMWHIKRWFLRLRTNIREHRQWLKKCEISSQTAPTLDDLVHLSSEIEPLEEFEVQQAKEIEGDVILDRAIYIVDILLLAAGISMIMYAFIMACLGVINAEVIVYFAVGTLSLIYVSFDRWCKKKMC